MITKTHRDRCGEEVTSDVIFLLRWRRNKSSSNWQVESVWLDRGEAEEFARKHEYRWPHWQVYGVPSEGVLAKLLRTDPCLEKREYE